MQNMPDEPLFSWVALEIFLERPLPTKKLVRRIRAI